MENWQPYGQAKSSDLRPAATPATAQTGSAPTETTREAVCVECGRIFNLDDMIRHGEGYVCANCKPVFLQKLKEGAKLSGGGLSYAGFWIRFAAKFVDGLILGVPFMMVFLFVGFRASQSSTPGEPDFLALAVQLGFYVINMCYTIFFLGKFGATPGKMVCKLHVVTAQGDKIGYGRATGRFFAEILSGMVCYIGYIIAAFDSQKRSLHDHICSTRVVYK
jgi:uncharacterized RDD family membrane protein YckC/DNA-directed RNA polymerase subunit RPC12/RpoP